MFSLTILVVATLCACAHAVNFEDCGSSYQSDTFELDTECSETYCNITAGETAKATITYTANSATQSLSQKLYVRLNGIFFRSTVTPEPCALGSGQTCPIQNGNKYTYEADVTFSMDLYPVTGYLNWTLRDIADKVVLCYKVNVNVYVPDSWFLET